MWANRCILVTVAKHLKASQASYEHAVISFNAKWLWTELSEGFSLLLYAPSRGKELLPLT